MKTAMKSKTGLQFSAAVNVGFLKRAKLLVAATSLVAIASASATVFAATPGDLDPAFAGSGYVTQAQGDLARGNAVMSDYKNRVVTAYSAINNAPGSFNEYSVMRHLDTGALDSGFGVGGIVNLPLPSKDLTCMPEIVEDLSTNLLVASCNANTIFVWRLKNTGVLDTPITAAVASYSVSTQNPATHESGGQEVVEVCAAVGHCHCWHRYRLEQHFT